MDETILGFKNQFGNALLVKKGTKILIRETSNWIFSQDTKLTVFKLANNFTSDDLEECWQEVKINYLFENKRQDILPRHERFYTELLDYSFKI